MKPCSIPTLSALTLSALALCSSALISSAGAATFTVTNISDAGAGTLRQAILNANAKPDTDTIIFASTVHGKMYLTSGELAISQSVTIQGPGSGKLTMTASEKSRLFNVTGGTVALSGLTLTQGSVLGANGTYGRPGTDGETARGGAIQNAGELTLTDVVLSNNAVTGGQGGNGGGGFSSRPRLGDGGKGGDGLGGAIYNAGTLTISQTQFLSNSATGGNGGKGGINMEMGRGGSGGNGGDAVGGAIYNAGTLKQIGLTSPGNTFSGNTVAAGGAGTGIGAGPGSAGRAHWPNIGVPLLLAQNATIAGNVNSHLSAQLIVDNNFSGRTLTYSVVANTLPAGLRLDAKTGVISGTPAGEYEGTVVTYKASDGQQTSNVATITFNIGPPASDTTKPVVSFSTPTSNQTLPLSSFNNATVTGTATDDAGVTQVTVKLLRSRNGIKQYWNGTAFTTTAATVPATLAQNGAMSTAWRWYKQVPTPSQLDAGAYTIYAYAFDAAGNQSAAISRTFTLSANSSDAPSENDS